jgi:hypothetical protein
MIHYSINQYGKIRRIMRKIRMLSKATIFSLGLVTVVWVFTQSVTPDKTPKGIKLNLGNSDILSNKVAAIFIDSFDVKWFGTDKGISRFDGVQWDTFNINSAIHLLNNNVKKIAYERSSYGHEIWIATDRGLTVAGFNVDGVTSATTYYKGGTESGIVNDTITAIGIDVLHNRWIGTKKGLNVFGPNGWDSLKTYEDSDFGIHNLTKVLITDIAGYDNNASAYISTYGGGIIRYNYNDIDGFTGASTLDNKWSRLPSNYINSVTIIDTVQYYGSLGGLYKHNGADTKHYWTFYSTADGLISNNVLSVEVDNNGAVWIGTDQGLNIKNGKKWFTYVTSDGLINPVINDIKKDFSGNVWIATNGGVEYFSAIPGRQTGGFNPIQTRNVIAFNVTADLSDIEWTNGDEDQRVVFIKAGSDGLVAPVDNKTYHANSTFGAGDEENGWYCIYNGMDNSMTVTGLSANTMYRIMACEYSGNIGSEKYFKEEAVGNPANFTTLHTGIEWSKTDNFEIYPNPFNSILNLKNTGSLENYNVSVYSSDGKILYNAKVTSKESSINTSVFKAGIYIIQITNGKESYSYKVLKN